MGQHMEPQFPARDRTPAPCSGSWSLNRWPPGGGGVPPGEVPAGDAEGRRQRAAQPWGHLTARSPQWREPTDAAEPASPSGAASSSSSKPCARGGCLAP